MKQLDRICRRAPSLVTVISVLTLLLVIPAANAAGQDNAIAVSADRPDLAHLAREVPLGARLNLQRLYLTELGAVDLELERFRVFAEGAEIVAGSTRRPVPDNAYFRGAVADLPGSRVVLSFRQRGGISGFVLEGGDLWTINGRLGRSGLSSEKVDLELDAKSAAFACLTETLEQPGGRARQSPVGPSIEELTSAAAFSYTARVAVETDWEFLGLFGGDQAAATDYVGDLFAFASSIYESEVDTSLFVSYLELWPGGASSDPWTTGDYDGSGGVDCRDRLYEFRDYWNANRSGVDRAVAHMLSGKSTGCGIAYVGVLCDTSYGYGVSGSLRGNFDPGNPTPPVWDIIVASHEIGHNFNSPHTHCYKNIPDSSHPQSVDTCYGSQSGSSCYSGPVSLPAGCPGAGLGCGTIMSYCHLLSGSYGNLALTFGGSVTGGGSHPFGTEPERVPQRMYSHVLSRAASGCLDPVLEGPTLTVSKTGSGDGTVTSDDGGIDCGSDCSETYAVGADPTVTLSAAAAAGSHFAGWGGACNGNQPSTQVTVDADRLCTATFNSSCGNGVIDPGEICDGADLGGASCADQGCAGGTLLCRATCDALDYSNCSACPCDFDGVCEFGEDCDSCPSDCAAGQTSGAVCGNGRCEAGNGEDCVSCAADCNGLQKGKPEYRFCCGATDGCADSRCTSGGFSCTETPSQPGQFCCGDAICEVGEDCGTCALDCKGPVEICGDGFDNDCNGVADCDDAICAGDPGTCPTCKAKGASCDANEECCSGRCEARGNSNPKCR